MSQTIVDNVPEGEGYLKNVIKSFMLVDLMVVKPKHGFLKMSQTIVDNVENFVDWMKFVSNTSFLGLISNPFMSFMRNV